MIETVIKRDGRVKGFDGSRIYKAIRAAFKETDIPPKEADKCAKEISIDIRNIKQAQVGIEEIQDEVVKGLRSRGYTNVADAYEAYRKKRTALRKNTIEDSILDIVDGTSAYWNGENANKNPRLNTTIRDYIAGEVSTDITLRRLLPNDIAEAEKQGEIHFHDRDYFIQHMYNCCLINLEDILQNGTVISETMITKPHSFRTACTIATQVIAQVASNQYGGQSISLAHLAPFVDISRKSIQKEVQEEFRDIWHNGEQVENIVNKRLMKEIKSGIQTIQYQLITLNTTNGQAPFITVFMYLNEAKNEQEKNDLALIIEETLNQRIKGVQAEDGHWIAPSFPKLIYVLENDNIHESDKYWYLTELAARCTTKRLVPDYISEKIMFETKDDVFPCINKACA